MGKLSRLLLALTLKSSKDGVGGYHLPPIRIFGEVGAYYLTLGEERSTAARFQAASARNEVSPRSPLANGEDINDW